MIIILIIIIIIMRRSWKRYEDLALKIKRIHRAMKVTVIPIVIGALKNCKSLIWEFDCLKNFWKCIVVSHPWYCSYLTESVGCVKVMLNKTIHNNDFQHNTTLQHCCDIVWNGYSIVLTLQRCVALKIVIANRPL